MATGRPPHEPTRDSRRLVEHHAATGTLHQQIAKLLGLSLNTLKKHYAEELELGLARANAVVSGTLFAEAKKRQHHRGDLLAEDPRRLARDREGRAQRRHLGRGPPARCDAALGRDPRRADGGPRAMRLSESDWLAIEREFCARKLVNFIERAWPVVEPGTPLRARLAHRRHRRASRGGERRARSPGS